MTKFYKRILSASAFADSFKLTILTLHLRHSLSENSSIAPTALLKNLSSVRVECEIEFCTLAMTMM